MAAAHSSPAPSAADPPARSHVRDFMQLGLSHCAPDDDLSAVARTMAEQRVHSVVVAGIARRDHPGEHLGWGIVTDMDLMCALRPGAGDPTAGEVAGTEIVTISPRDSLEQAVQRWPSTTPRTSSSCPRRPDGRSACCRPSTPKR